tara:strand:+ start:117 stop:374 length:258 start_codon:yes stop_codon:yes gene_type:complete
MSIEQQLRNLGVLFPHANALRCIYESHRGRFHATQGFPKLTRSKLRTLEQRGLVEAFYYYDEKYFELTELGETYVLASYEAERLI